MLKRLLGTLGVIALLSATACDRKKPNDLPPKSPGKTPVAIEASSVFQSATIAKFESPWSLAILPDGSLLVTERPASAIGAKDATDPGRLWIIRRKGEPPRAISGLPDNVGLLDVKLAPDFAKTHHIYISFVERDSDAPRIGRNSADRSSQPSGLAVLRASLSEESATLKSSKIIWRQRPKIVSHPGSGEFGGRLTFSPDGTYIFIASGDRQELDKNFLFSLNNNLGKIIRLVLDGSVPGDNPYEKNAGALAEIWSIGHRNQYGLSFNAQGRLFEAEMGPEGGDELNIIEPEKNYGWPDTSYGNHYGGEPIKRPQSGDGQAQPVYWWNPIIAPSDLIFYAGTRFPFWKDNAIIAGLASEALIRVEIQGNTAREIQRIAMGNRIRSVREAPDGSLYILEDQPGGRLINLSPRSH